MNSKLGQDKAKAGKRVKSNNTRCITCQQSCSMSGLCMKPWPEFSVSGLKGVINDDTDHQKNS